ncbi:helix-turn-helix transcriptional regulator [Acidovorax sp. LjRoot194]|uniref:helix-turn-helix transcriptional regulator n=1 Tax=Acidovorax sp. LjRoot194 TaxID=3342280 RepID=UPI003ECCEAE2
MGQIILNKAQLLEELAIVENTLRALIEQREFPRPRKMGSKLFWLISEVAEWLHGCPKAWAASVEPGPD